MKCKLKTVLKNSEHIYDCVSCTYNYLFEFYSYYLRLESKFLTWYRYGQKFEAEIDPLRVIHIDPANVDKMIEKQFFDHPDHISEIKGGDWDSVIEPITEYDLYLAMESVFKNGGDWKKTDFYNRIISTINNGGEKWGCSSKSEFDKRCDRLDNLYLSIKNNGYMSQASLLSNRSDDPIQNKRNYRFAPELSEIVVVIGQSGEIYFYDGRHRFIISKIIGIDSIPVRVKARHVNWQRLRDEYINDSKVGWESHPDLGYL